MWNVTSGESLLVLRGHDNRVTSVAFSPDGSRIVSGSHDETVRVWNATSGESLLVLRGHDERRLVNSVAFSPDGSRLVSGSRDRTVRVWNATSGENLLVLRGHDYGVNSVAFSSDGSRIVSGSSDKTVRVWESSAAMIQDPTREVAIAATQLVPSLFDHLVLVEDVIHRLQTDGSLREDVRAVAIRLARLHEDDPIQINKQSWSVVKLPDEEPEAYERAARLAEAACRMKPADGYYLNTLGVGQFRLGDYEKTLTSLTRSNELNKGKQPADFAFLAMANQRLGRIEEARATLARLRELMREEELAGDEESRGFLAEAEALIGD